MRNDIKIPSSTLAELRNVLVRALSKENLSETDKHKLFRSNIRKSQSSSSLKIHYTVSSNYGGKKWIPFFVNFYFMFALAEGQPFFVV